MDSDVESLIRGCYVCQITATIQISYKPLGSTIIHPGCWDTLAMDVQGPYHTSDYLAVLINYRTTFPIFLLRKNPT